MKTPIPISIDDMEETAKQEADGCCNEKIRGEYLLDDTFRYRWGKNIVPREVAINVLASK